LAGEAGYKINWQEVDLDLGKSPATAERHLALGARMVDGGNPVTNPFNAAKQFQPQRRTAEGLLGRGLAGGTTVQVAPTVGGFCRFMAASLRRPAHANNSPHRQELG
jgi:hypothetical protein